MINLVSPTTGIRLVVDPNNQHSNINMGNMYDYIGLIPTFITSSEEKIWDQVERSYGFPLCSMDGGRVDQDGNYHYPDDPMLSPIAQYITKTEVMHQYHYGICAIHPIGEPENAIVVRVD